MNTPFAIVAREAAQPLAAASTMPGHRHPPRVAINMLRVIAVLAALLLVLLPELAAAAPGMPAVTATPAAGGGTQYSLSLQTLLLMTGVVSTERALEGFANEGLITVGVLFAVAEGLRQTGGTNFLGQRILGRPRSVADAQVRIMLPTIFLSAFLNNTPVVAVLLPVLNDWAKKAQLSVSKLMLPLSYAAILGGMCTLIGTSTTLVLNKKLQDDLARAEEAGA